MFPQNKKVTLIIGIIITCSLLCSCQVSGRKHLRENFSIGQTSVRGMAENGNKTGAFVVTKMEQHVFVEGLQNWPGNLLGREVVVSGTLKWDADAGRFAVGRANWEPAPEEEKKR